MRVIIRLLEDLRRMILSKTPSVTSNPVLLRRYSEMKTDDQHDRKEYRTGMVSHQIRDKNGCDEGIADGRTSQPNNDGGLEHAKIEKMWHHADSNRCSYASHWRYMNRQIISETDKPGREAQRRTYRTLEPRKCRRRGQPTGFRSEL